MSVLINTNSSATGAAVNLNRSSEMLAKSLARLSSGSKIVSSSDDAGGLAVATRMAAAIKRTSSANTNIGNAQSFLTTQDGALSTAHSILQRVSELKVLSQDTTKSTADIANYNTEFTALKGQLTSISTGTFNGVNLFGAGTGSVLAVTITETGATTNINQSGFANAVSNTTGATSLAALTVTANINDITSVATARAVNGAQSSVLGYASDLLTTNKTNLEAAMSRIMDVDVAEESTSLARYNILVQAGASMLAQANASSQVALSLLG